MCNYLSNKSHKFSIQDFRKIVYYAWKDGEQLLIVGKFEPGN